MGGKTKRDKLQTYVEPDLGKKFKDYCIEFELTESKGLERILCKFFGHESASESAANPEVENRLEYLESQLSELIELSRRIADNISEVDQKCSSDLESLNNLCKFSFESAFNRIGRLERGERVNDLGLDESASESAVDLQKASKHMSNLATHFNASEVVVTASYLDDSVLSDARPKIAKAKKLAADIKLSQAELATRLNSSERSLQRWKMKPEAEYHNWLDKHEPAPNLVWKPIPNTTLFQPDFKPLPLENGFGDPVDPSLEYRYNAAIKAIEELAESARD